MVGGRLGTEYTVQTTHARFHLIINMYYIARLHRIIVSAVVMSSEQTSSIQTIDLLIGAE